MKILDSGHTYEVATYDANSSDVDQRIKFMKREGEGFPGNVGHYSGTNCQEVIRVLIDRVKYLDNQIPCENNKRILKHLRSSLLEFEIRAASRHEWDITPSVVPIEDIPVCPTCGHIVCKGKH